MPAVFGHERALIPTLVNTNMLRQPDKIWRSAVATLVLTDSITWWWHHFSGKLLRQHERPPPYLPLKCFILRAVVPWVPHSEPPELSELMNKKKKKGNWSIGCDWPVSVIQEKCERWASCTCCFQFHHRFFFFFPPALILHQAISFEVISLRYFQEHVPWSAALTSFPTHRQGKKKWWTSLLSALWAQSTWTAGCDPSKTAAGSNPVIWRHTNEPVGTNSTNLLYLGSKAAITGLSDCCIQRCWQSSWQGGWPAEDQLPGWCWAAINDGAPQRHWALNNLASFWGLIRDLRGASLLRCQTPRGLSRSLTITATPGTSCFDGLSVFSFSNICWQDLETLLAQHIRTRRTVNYHLKTRQDCLL